MIIRRAVLFAAMVVAAACGGTTSVDDLHLIDVIGTWNLKTVNGAVPPAVVQASPKIELLTDAYTFNANGTYSESGSQRTTTSTGLLTETVTENGNWIRTNTTLALTPTTGGTYPGVATDTSLTFTFGTFVLVYKR